MNKLTLDKLTKIEKENPLEGYYETDARYIWPKRWKLVKEALAAEDEQNRQEEE